jgi:hypothetical protein
MVRRRAVAIGLFAALTAAAGLTSRSASAFVPRDVYPVPFDGKMGDPGSQQRSPGMSCMVLGASCNKGPMPPSMGGGGRWEHGYPGRDNDYPRQGWPRTMQNKGLGGPY